MNTNSFLILFIIFIAMITIVPLLMKKIHIPGVISLLLVGMLIGPNSFDLVDKIAHALNFLGTNSESVASNFNSFITALGSLGLVFLMALAGMEADFKLINKTRKPVIALSILTFLVPAITGFFVYGYFKPDDFAGKLLYASLFASHSVGIVFPIIRELNLSKTFFGASVLISTVVTDVASILLLAVSVQIKKQSIDFSSGGLVSKSLSIFDYLDPSLFGGYFVIFFLILVLAYLALSIFLISKFGKIIFTYTEQNRDILITFLLLVILVTVLIGEFLGVNMVVGAFIAGLGLSTLLKQSDAGVKAFFRFEGIGYGLLIPFLFVTIGMQTDWSAFNSISNVEIILYTVVGLIVSKVLSGWFAMRINKFSNAKGLCAGLMTVPQLSATLAAAAVGKDLGMLDDQFFNAIVILSIITTLPIPSLVRFIIYKCKINFTATDEEAYLPPAGTEDELL